MRYISTRRSSSSSTTTQTFSFEEAILGGYAPDGGLFVPEVIPTIDAATLQAWTQLSYPELATTILSLFIDETEIPRQVIVKICQQSYASFDDPETCVPVVPLTTTTTTTSSSPPTTTSNSNSSLFVAELFHGPTFCFKDLGLRILIQFLAYFATKRQQPISLLVATTGDTGPAAVQAVQDAACPYLSIVVHYPKGQISSFQQKQLTTVDSPWVQIVEFEGGGDDMDVPIKAILSENASSTASTTADKRDRLICGINSFNIGRPLAQMTHFVWTYLRVMESLGISPGDPSTILDVIVPTGAMGNLVAGYMAQQMGIPLGKFTAAVNVNDITDTVLSTGIVVKTTEPMKQTLSEAINIQLPYNLERVLYYLTGQDAEQIRTWYTTLERTGRMELGPKWLQALQSAFQSARITDETLCATMVSILETYHYWIDPHTGVALAAAEQLGYLPAASEQPSCVIVATASPCKFQSALTTALGAEKWKEYEQHGFPESGKRLLEAPEIPPVRHQATESSLAANQVQWEQRTREILKALEQK